MGLLALITRRNSQLSQYWVQPHPIHWPSQLLQYRLPQAIVVGAAVGENTKNANSMAISRPDAAIASWRTAKSLGVGVNGLHLFLMRHYKAQTRALGLIFKA